MSGEVTVANLNSDWEQEVENRRLRERFPINCKIVVTPANEHSTLLSDEAFIAFGKDISRSGVCFTHELPLTHRRLFLSFHAIEFGEFILEVEVVRSRYTAIGLYDIGCRMLRKIVAPSRFTES